MSNHIRYYLLNKLDTKKPPISCFGVLFFTLWTKTIHGVLSSHFRLYSIWVSVANTINFKCKVREEGKWCNQPHVWIPSLFTESYNVDLYGKYILSISYFWRGNWLTTFSVIFHVFLIFCYLTACDDLMLMYYTLHVHAQHSTKKNNKKLFDLSYPVWPVWGPWSYS